MGHPNSNLVFQIADLEEVRVDRFALQRLVELCQCDVRFSINTLQFVSVLAKNEQRFISSNDIQKVRLYCFLCKSGSHLPFMFRLWNVREWDRRRYLKTGPPYLISVIILTSSLSFRLVWEYFGRRGRRRLHRPFFSCFLH